ncbi:hypothetical protein QVD99_004220 [Batrachochytrium dendrobatidis]|nr:hypothetical protein QVD99_004220 [Batrachochytrium dendrobatidis]
MFGKKLVLKTLSNKRPLDHDSDDAADSHSDTGVFRSSTTGSKVARIDQSTASTTAALKQSDDEEDPLDAFMKDLEATKPSSNPSTHKLLDGFDNEDDHIESYVKHLQSKGVQIGAGNSSAIHQTSDVDSDEEVYATARAIDAQEMRNLGLNEMHAADGSKKEIDPLPFIDHAAMDYPDFSKNFYTEHQDISQLSDTQVQTIRQQLDMRVFGKHVPRPCISFAHFGFDESLLNCIIKHGYTEPTGIQRQAVPVALSGHDLIGIAQTGSGKTAAFLWPMLVHLMDQPELERGDGPIGLVLAPTRELAHQIYLEAKKFSKAYQGVRVTVLYGGVSKNDQFKELRAGVEILVATPGRLIDLIKMKATNLTRVTYLVLDEADQMLNLGFEPQVRSICDHIRPDRQTLLFSATFRKRIEHLVRALLNNPTRISIGNVGQSNSDITQIPVVLENDGVKFGWLTAHLPRLVAQGPVLVFVSRKAGVDELASNLSAAVGRSILSSESNSFPNQQQIASVVGALHGDLMQAQRDQVLKEFKSGKSRVLVSTDVASRGLDIKGVKTVINYDVSKDIDSYVHRIGRTGRAGEKGTAYTLITMQEDRFASDLVQLMENGNQAPTEALVNLAMQNPWFRKMKQGGGRGARGEDRGRGRGSRGRGRTGLGFQRGNRGRGGNHEVGTGSNSLHSSIAFTRSGTYNK